MKRRTRRDVGNWPNMRADTLKQISDELIRARKKHSKNSPSLKMAENYLEALRNDMIEFERGKSSTAAIYAGAATVAAMCIRVMEEGSGGSKYRGNTLAPEFSLGNIDNDIAD